MVMVPETRMIVGLLELSAFLKAVGSDTVTVAPPAPPVVVPLTLAKPSAPCTECAATKTSAAKAHPHTLRNSKQIPERDVVLFMITVFVGCWLASTRHYCRIKSFSGRWRHVVE